MTTLPMRARASLVLFNNASVPVQAVKHELEEMLGMRSEGPMGSYPDPHTLTSMGIPN